jgi:hypothetical protein
LYAKIKTEALAVHGRRIGRGRQFGGLHARGAFVAFADGSIRQVSESVDPLVFEGIATMAGGERLPAEW